MKEKHFSDSRAHIGRFFIAKWLLGGLGRAELGPRLQIIPVNPISRHCMRHLQGFLLALCLL